MAMEYQALSLLPPMVAIVLAIATRRVVAPLALGVAVGAYLLSPPDAPWWQPAVGFAVSIWESFSAFDHLQALAFSLLLGAMVGVLEFGGAMESLVRSIAKRIKTRKGAQTMIATSGLAIFFDDYSNTLLVGGTMRSTADRYQISRSKLAYLVDSTAAPVAGLSAISTWAATEISYMVDGLNAAGVTDPSAGFELFLRSIPYRFYPCFALVLVFMVARSGRDFGPMRTAERLTLAGKPNDRTSTKSGNDSDSEAPHVSHAWLPTVVPVLICILSVILTLVVTGYQSVGGNVEGLAWWRYVGVVIGKGDSYLALILGGAAGWICTVFAHRVVCRCSIKTLARGTVHGAWHMLPAMVILWLAWALSAMTDEGQLDTGGYLANMLTDRLDPKLLPTLVFLIASVMSFSTGTSWGTMAILTPLSVTLSLSLDLSTGGVPDPQSSICLATCGSVLAGAIFGDHCSPISDTTVLSSRASSCDHVQHVRTQMPYALVVAVFSIVFGCLPAAYGISPWLSLAVGAVALWLMLKTVGKPIEQEASTGAA